MKNLRTALLTLCALVAFTPAAKADIQAIRSADNEIWGSAGPSLFNYKEPATQPNLPDSEHGWIPSVAGGISVLSSGDSNGILPSNIYLSFDANVAFGNVAYNGSYLNSPTVPLHSTTHETISNVEGKIGKGFVLNNNAMLIPYGEIGFRAWKRELTASQIEDYQNFDAMGGLMLQIAPTNRLVLSAYGSAGTTLSAQLKTGGVTYNLGDSGIYKVGGKIGFDLTQRVELFTTLDYDHFRYGRSPVINGLYEPNSHTEDTTMRVGLGYQFR